VGEGGRSEELPEEIALGEEPGSLQPGEGAQLLELLVVAGHVGVAIVADWPVVRLLLVSIFSVSW
jgi:hypothetical protein